MAGFGLAEFSRTQVGNNLLVYDSRSHPGIRHQFAAKRKNRGDGSVMYRCLNCHLLNNRITGVPRPVPYVKVVGGILQHDPDNPSNPHFCTEKEHIDSVIKRQLRAETRLSNVSVEQHKQKKEVKKRNLDSCFMSQGRNSRESMTDLCYQDAEEHLNENANDMKVNISSLNFDHNFVMEEMNAEFQSTHAVDSEDVEKETMARQVIGEKLMKALFERAVDAKNFAYCPYSKFQVGAALLCEDGSIYTGCNVENASFGLTVCAERTAIVKAVSEGKTKFLSIAITTNVQNEVSSPCGACRQFMVEFGNFDVYLVKADGRSWDKFTTSELLPFAFNVDILRKGCSAPQQS